MTDANGRPISLFMTAGQVSDYAGAAAPLDSLPRAQWLLGDQGYDADWFRAPCRPRASRPASLGQTPGPLRQAQIQAAQPHRTEGRRSQIMFGRLKDWRRVATRYDRCPTVFVSAKALAATVLFWL